MYRFKSISQIVSDYIKNIGYLNYRLILILKLQQFRKRNDL